MDNHIDKKELSEEDIKNRYITPALNSAGWNNDEFRMELKVKTQFTDGKISLSGNRAHRENQNLPIMFSIPKRIIQLP